MEPNARLQYLNSKKKEKDYLAEQSTIKEKEI